MVVKTNNPGDAIIEAWVLDEELQNQRPALLFAFVNSQTKEYYYGFGSVTTYDFEAAHDDVMTKSIEIAGKGPITKAENFDANTLPETATA
jgi:predicted secreted protein